jgi:hypothetical protein
MDFLIDCGLGALLFAGYVVFCLIFGSAGNRFTLKD